MEHPITPPPELVQQWRNSWHFCHGEFVDYVAAQAARWGADQRGAATEAKLQEARDEELEACCEEMKSLPSPLGIPFGTMASNALRAARRSKPPSLKEQALDDLTAAERLYPADWSTIRKALEALPND